MPFYAAGAGAPSFIEEDMFTAVLPLAPVAEEFAGRVTPQITPQAGKPLEGLKGEMSCGELLEKLRQKDRRDRYLYLCSCSIQQCRGCDRCFVGMSLVCERIAAP